MADDNYTNILLEEMRDQNKAILEYVADLPTMKDDIADLKEDVAELKQDMKVVKAAVTDLSNKVADHEHHITRLETA